jgi:flagellar hook assembly protein FlgD
MGTVTGVEELPTFADRLFQNYPNPFNPTTTIEYTVAKTRPVTITIYNVKGQRVRQLVDESRPPGRHTATWDGTTDRGDVVASGVYFYRIRIGGFTDVKKMVVLK